MMSRNYYFYFSLIYKKGLARLEDPSGWFGHVLGLKNDLGMITEQPVLKYALALVGRG